MEKKFKGENEAGRVVKNPEIRVYRFSPGAELDRAIQKRSSVVNIPVHLNDVPAGSGKENYFWLDRRVSKVAIADLSELKKLTDHNGNIRLKFSLMTPWPGQKLTLSLPGWKYEWQAEPSVLGLWTEVTALVPYEKLRAAGGLTAEISQVHSPYTQDIGSDLRRRDSRRLGVAVREIKRGG